MKPNALVFDIETIADLTPQNREAVTKLAEGRQMRPEDYGSLCPPLARVVCIAFLDVAAQTIGALFDASLCAGAWPSSVDITAGDGSTRACNVRGCAGESDVLREFGHMVEQHVGQSKAQLVTYNGRGFDLPVLIHRSIKYGVTEGRALLLKAVNENRYRPLLHVDLQDAVTFCGASGRFPMAAYAIGYGWRSPKEEMDGAQVAGAVRNGKIVEVVRYCARDVLATAHLYARLNGEMPVLESPPSSTESV